MISTQANLLFLLACPLGIILGYFLGYLNLSPMLQSLSGIEKIELSYLPIIITSCLFTYLTLSLSIHKPKNLAGKMTSIEATKYTGHNETQKQFREFHCKNYILEICVNAMLQRKKILAVTTASIVSGMALLGLIYQVTTAIDLETYGSKMIAGNYIISANNDKFLNPQDTNTENSMYLEDTTYETIRKQPGVLDVEKVYSHPLTITNNNLDLDVEIIGVNSIATDFIKGNQENYLEGKFDYDEFISGNYVILTKENDDNFNNIHVPYHVGDTILINGKQYQVMAILSKWFNVGEQRVYQIGSFRVYMPEAEYFNSITSDDIFCKLICKTNKTFNMDSIHFTENNFTISSRQDRIDKVAKTITAMRLVGFGLSFVLLLIGILNLINTYFTTIYSRKKEFSILESLGMTKKQRILMFFTEGMLYTLIIGGIFITIGRLFIRYFTQVAHNTLNFISNTENTSMYFWMILVLIVFINCVIYLSCRTIFRKPVAMRINE